MIVELIKVIVINKTVESLDSIPYGKIPKWGQTARFLINTKQKLGLGLKKTHFQKT